MDRGSTERNFRLSGPVTSVVIGVREKASWMVQPDGTGRETASPSPASAVDL